MDKRIAEGPDTLKGSKWKTELSKKRRRLRRWCSQELGTLIVLLIGIPLLAMVCSWEQSTAESNRLARLQRESKRRALAQAYADLRGFKLYTCIPKYLHLDCETYAPNYQVIRFTCSTAGCLQE